MEVEACLLPRFICVPLASLFPGRGARASAGPDPGSRGGRKCGSLDDGGGGDYGLDGLP